MLNYPLTFVQMLIPNRATVRAVVNDARASLTLQTQHGLIRVDVRHIDDTAQPQLTGRARKR